LSVAGATRARLVWHGGGGASSEVRQFAPALAAAGYSVYAPDAPGYGRSPPVEASRYRPSALAELAVALMDALGLAPVVWVGSSWGAKLGVHTAGRFPKRFTGLVLR
jgi:pimeloyl-ACP methyl ester carboxylesterase